MGSGGVGGGGGRISAGEEEEDWNKSSFKRFDWDEGLEEATFNSFDKDRCGETFRYVPLDKICF